MCRLPRNPGLYADMQERGLSARTVRFTHAVLRAAFHQAVKWRLIPQNPCESVDLPKQAKGEIQVLNPQQARDFLKEAAQDRYHCCPGARRRRERCRGGRI
jgi:site-specific recombinase XerD